MQCAAPHSPLVASKAFSCLCSPLSKQFPLDFLEIGVIHIIRKLRSELVTPHSEFYFLYADEQLAGYLKLNEVPSQSDINDPNSLEVQRIYVCGRFQGMGLGRYLLNTALQMAAERGKQYVWLGAWENNEKALRFYHKMGFRPVGTHPFIMGNDRQTDYIMRRDLN